MNEKYGYVEVGSSVDWKLYRIVPNEPRKGNEFGDSNETNTINQQFPIHKGILTPMTEKSDKQRANFIVRSAGKSTKQKQNTIRGFTAT